MKETKISEAVSEALRGPEPVNAPVSREQIKDDLHKLIAMVDTGEFRGAIITIYDVHAKQNIVRLWGDRSAVHQSAIRVLQSAGILRTPPPPRPPTAG